MGRARRLKSIEVKVVPQDAYPALRKDKDHHFSGMNEERRLEEATEIFARVLAQNIRDLAAKKAKATSEAGIGEERNAPPTVREL